MPFLQFSGSSKGSALASASSSASGPPIPRSGMVGLFPEEQAMWRECVAVVREKLGEITGNVAITMGGTHGQINVNTHKSPLHDTRTEFKIPPFVAIPRGLDVFQILAAPFTIPHYGVEADFERQVAASSVELESFLRTPVPTPMQVVAIADKMKSGDLRIGDLLQKTLPAEYRDSDGQVRSKLEKVATMRRAPVPISYTAYKNANVNDPRVCAYPQWGVGDAAVAAGSAPAAAAAASARSLSCEVPLLDKTYLLTEKEYKTGVREREHEWKFTLYYLGKGGRVMSFNILKALIQFAPIARHADMMEEKHHALRQDGMYKFITTQNIVDLVHGLGFTTHLHVDVTCNVIRDGAGYNLQVGQEKTMRRDLNLLYIPHQLAIQVTGRVPDGLVELLRELLYVKIAGSDGGGYARTRTRTRTRTRRRHRRRRGETTTVRRRRRRDTVGEFSNLK